MAEYTSDQLRLILAMSADITSLQNSLKKATGDTKRAADNMNTSLNSIGRGGGGASGIDTMARRQTDAVSKMSGSMRAATGNMTAQLNDITSTLLSGSSPFTVMVQQGSQVSQILQEMASRAQATGQSFSIFQLLGGAFKNLVSPMSLVVNGMILLAGTALPKIVEGFKEFFGSSEDSEKALKKQADAVNSLVSAYNNLVPILQKVKAEQDKREEQANAETAYAPQIKEAYEQATPALKEFANAAANASIELADVGSGFDTNQVAAFQSAWTTFFDAFKAGKAGPEEFAKVQETLNPLVATGAKSATDMQAALDKMAPAFQGVMAVAAPVRAEFEKAKDGTLAFHKALNDLAENGVAPLTGVEKELKEALDDYTKASEKATTVEDKLLVAEAWRKVEDAIKNSSAVLKEQGEKARTAVENQLKYKDAMLDMLRVINPQFVEHIKQIDSITEAWNRASDAVANLDGRQQGAMQRRADVQFGDARDAANIGGSVLDYIRKREGLIFKAQWDVNHPRVGYGSDTVTMPDGSFRPTQKGETVTLADAERDLVRRVTNFTNDIIAAIGPDRWAAFSEEQKKALTSITYNYGQLPKSIVEVIKRGGTTQEIAQAIYDKRNDAPFTKNGQAVNFNRRIQESEIFASGTEFQGGKSPADQQREKNDELQREGEIRKQLNSGIDATVAKREYELKLGDLRAEAEKRALESGVAVSQEELKRIDAEARRYGDMKGRIEANNKALKDQKNLQDALISVSNKTDVINAELEAVNALGGAYDKLVYSQEKAAITASLMNKAREDGTEATASEKASIDAVAEAQAKALATQALYKQGQRDFKKAQDDNKQSAQQLAETYAGMATQFFTGFISDLRNGKSATEALSNALGRLGDQLLDMALNQLFKSLFSNLFGVGGGTGTGLSFFPSAPTMKAGGTVGMSRHMDGRRFNPLLWSGAPKFQAGGMVGLLPGEVPIIAHRGELVIPAGQTQRGGSVTGDDNRQYNIGIKVDSNGRSNLTEGNGTLLGKKLNMAVQEVIAREQRSGGLLHGTGPGAR